MRTKTNQTVSILLLGVFLCSVWFAAGYMCSFSTPLCEPDAPIYWQYARSAAQGHPFSYTPPDGPSTGCTSTLYPFLIAPLYTLFGSAQFPNAVFVFQAVLFLISLGLIASIAKKRIPETAWLALLATALSGQTLRTFLGMTDMGLLITLVLFCAWALAHKKPAFLCIGAFLCGLTHPASLAVCAGLLLAGVWQATETGSVRYFLRQLFAKKNIPLYAGLCGITAVALTLILNYFMTGSAQFMSLRQKGLFTLYPPLAALNLTAANFITLLKGLFFGLDNSVRQFFFLPVLTGGIALYGLLLCPWKQRRKTVFDIFVVGAWLAGLGLMSMNEKQSISFDRYAAWMFPLMYLYFAKGIHTISSVRKQAAIALTVFFLGVQLISLLFFTTSFLANSNKENADTGFFNKIMNHTNPGDRIGIKAASGRFWYLPERKIFHLYAMFNPEMATCRHYSNYIDVLKHEPDLRPDYWIIDEETAPENLILTNFTGQVLFSSTTTLSENNTMSFQRADWSVLGPALPVTPADWILKQRLDVGYAPDEKQAAYRIKTNVSFTKIFPSVCKDSLNGQPLVECGELILGSEKFQVFNINPDRPLHAILRTRRYASVHVNRPHVSSKKIYRMEPVIRLQIEVDGVQLPEPVAIHLPEEGFVDALLTIPGNLLTTSSPVIKISGDHFSYAYWFFQ